MDSNKKELHEQHINDFCSDKQYLEKIGMELELGILGKPINAEKNIFGITVDDKIKFLTAAGYNGDINIDEIKLMTMESRKNNYTLVEIEKLEKIIARAEIIENDIFIQDKEKYSMSKTEKIKNMLADEADAENILEISIPTLISEIILLYILEIDGKREHLSNVFNLPYEEIIQPLKERWIDNKINEFENFAIFFAKIPDSEYLKQIPDYEKLVKMIKNDLTTLQNELHFKDVYTLAYMSEHIKNVDEMIEILSVNTSIKNYTNEIGKLIQKHEKYRKYGDKIRKRKEIYKEELNITNEVLYKKEYLPYLTSCSIYTTKKKVNNLKDIFQNFNETMEFYTIFRRVFKTFLETYGKDIDSAEMRDSLINLDTVVNFIWRLEPFIRIFIDDNAVIVNDYSYIKEAAITRLKTKVNDDYFKYIFPDDYYNDEIDPNEFELSAQTYKDSIIKAMGEVEEIIMTIDKIVEYCK
jgi:hypothetical protein